MPTSTTITTPSPVPSKSSSTTFTLHNPPHIYLHLQVTGTTTTTNFLPLPTPLDEITLRTHLSAALAQYLGLTGTAIPVDIFKVERETGEAWVRILRGDERVVVAALSQWAGKGVVVRILGNGGWLGGLVGSQEVENEM